MWSCKYCKTQNQNNDNYCANCKKPRTGKDNSSNLKPLVLGISIGVVLVLLVVLIILALKPDSKTPPKYTNPPVTSSVSAPVSTAKPTPVPTPASTPKPTPKPTPEPKQESVYDIVSACGDVENVGIPDDIYVLDKYEAKYVKSGKGHSIYTFCDGEGQYKRPFYIYEEQEVLVLAENGGMSFVYFIHTDGDKKCAWVGSEWLVDQY